MGVFYLSDRGIRQALEQKILVFDPPLEDGQIQPASIDLLFDHVEDAWSLPETYRTMLKNRLDVVPAHSEVELHTVQHMSWLEGLRFYIELRSSLRRLSCHRRVGYTLVHPEGHVAVELYNHGGLNIVLPKGGRIAQLLFFFDKSPEVGLHRAGISGCESAALAYEKLIALDHGVEIKTSKEAWRLVNEGYLKVSPRAHFEKGMLKVYAGKTARVLRKNLTVGFSSKQDISAAFDDVRLPYRLMPGEHLVVETREDLELSPYVGIHFFDYMIGSGRGLSFFKHSPERVEADFSLMSMPDGWVDPGYKGVFTRQPKTLFKEGVVINEGDLLGHGLIIFFPKGVERPYGSAGLSSHYQNSDKARITQ